MGLSFPGSWSSTHCTLAVWHVGTWKGLGNEVPADDALTKNHQNSKYPCCSDSVYCGATYTYDSMIRLGVIEVLCLC